MPQISIVVCVDFGVEACTRYPDVCDTRIEEQSRAVALSAKVAVRILPAILMLIFMSWLLSENACGGIALEALRSTLSGA